MTTQFWPIRLGHAQPKGARGITAKAGLVLAAVVIVAVSVGDPVMGPALAFAQRIAAGLTRAPMHPELEADGAGPTSAEPSDGYVEAVVKIIAAEHRGEVEAPPPPRTSARKL